MSIKETLLQTAAAEIDEAVTALVKAQKNVNELVKKFSPLTQEYAALSVIDEQIEEAINRLGV